MQSKVPYATWPFINGIDVEGWRFGTLMRYVGQRWGDAFVEAPDGSRAGVVWIIRDGPIKQLLPPDPTRWGVYEVPFEREMQSAEDLLSNFKAVFGPLKDLHRDVTANPTFQRTAARPLN